MHKTAVCKFKNLAQGDINIINVWWQNCLHCHKDYLNATEKMILSLSMACHCSKNCQILLTVGQQYRMLSPPDMIVICLDYCRFLILGFLLIPFLLYSIIYQAAKVTYPFLQWSLSREENLCYRYSIYAATFCSLLSSAFWQVVSFLVNHHRLTI